MFPVNIVELAYSCNHRGGGGGEKKIVELPSLHEGEAKAVISSSATHIGRTSDERCKRTDKQTKNAGIVTSVPRMHF